MTSLFDKLVTLSPEQRALFEQKLAERGLTAPQPVGIPRRSAAAPTPLSFAQQRLWFIQQLDPTNTAYNVFSALRLKGALDIVVLEQTLNALVERHETLRTCFETAADNQPIQVVRPFAAIALPVVDLRQCEGNPREAEAKQINTLIQEPFDLTKPLLRLALLQVDDQEFLLVLATHHIISDRWSVMVFLREMTVLYNARQQGQPSPLASLPIQYGDWAVWQRQELQGEKLATQLAYWEDKLAGELPVLELPCDRPHPAVPSYQGAQVPIALSPELSTALRTLSSQSNTTLFVLLLTAFKILLHRYSDQDDILVGSDIANRDRTETEGLIGLLVNTLVLRSDLSGNPRFVDLLAQVRETVLGALAHRDLPFEKLVEVLNPERHLSQMMPLFQVKLDVQQARVQPVNFAGITLERYPLADNQVKYELRFNLQDTEQGITGQVEYSTDLFDAATVARMVGHFQVLLAGIVADPTQPLSDLPLMSEVEQHTLLYTWNQTQTPYPDTLCIHQLFEAQAARTPEAPALIDEHQSLTYRELEQQSHRLAAHLMNLGVGPEVLVGICMNRSVDMVVGLLGILQAGGAYVPLDPAYPAERLAFIVDDAQIKVLLVDDEVPFAVDGRALTLVNPSEPETDRKGERPFAPTIETSSPNVTPDCLAYVIYTSGSTGRPKGVAIAHRNTVAMLQWAKTQFGPDELAGVLASTSICFDLSVFELFAPLSWGGCIILAENALALPQLPAAEQVTLVNTVPSAMTELVNLGSLPTSLQTVNLAGEAFPPSLAQKLQQLPHIQHIYNLYGPSEDTTYSTVADVAALETTPIHRVPIGRPIANTQAYVCDRHGKPVPIGIPGELFLSGAGIARGYLNREELTAERFVANSKFKIQNSKFGRQESGGAIQNSKFKIQDSEGRGQASGVRSQESESINQLPTPIPPSLHPPIPPSSLYRTGDRVRYLPNGSLEFLGRFDHQVKIRGFRIETGEIEAVLSQHPAVKETIVVAWEEAGDVQLVAYVVKAEDRRQKAEGRKNSKFKIQNLEARSQESGVRSQESGVRREQEPRTKNQEPRTKNQEQTQNTSPFRIPNSVGPCPSHRVFRIHLSHRLPAYMVPNRFVELEALPRLPNGKVDWRSLPQPDGMQRDESRPFVAPRTEVERVLAAIWCRELTLDRVGVHDNFFELGGHSLLGMRVMAQAEQALAQSIRLKWLFQTPTIAGLAAHLEEAESSLSSSAPPLPSPLTFDLKIDPEAHHAPFPLTDIQQAYLLGRSRAFELGNVATHGYREIETVGLSVWQVERALRSQIERHDMLRVVVTPEGQQRVLPEVSAYEIRVTDLRSMAPEAQQAELVAMRDRLSHQMHDVEQWPLFTIEAAQLTADRVRFLVGFDVLIGDAWSFQLLGWELAQDLQGTPLPDLGLTFRDYVLAEQAFRESEAFQQAWTYWQGRLADLPPAPELPLAVAPSSIEQPQFERRSDRLVATDWQRVKRRAQQAGLTPSGVLLAAFAEVLATWSRHPRFTLNLTLFNRLPLHPDVNRIVGDFTSSLLLAVDNTGIDSFVTRARQLQSQLWEDLEQRAVSGVQVLRELARTQQRAGAALMPVVFTSTLNQQRPDTGDRPWQTEVVYGVSQTSQVYLDHQVSEIDGELVFNWDAIADLFPAGMLDAMFQAYKQFLQCLADGDAAWETPPQLSPTAHVEALNQTTLPLFSDPEALLHTLFFDQAQQQPEHPAVIAGDRTLTYSELSQRVSHLAHHLRQLDVQPNQLIAVSMTKGWEPVVAVLAILTAGAAYVPIDPTLPQERRWHLIQETQAAILLTQPYLANVEWPDGLTLITIETDLGAEEGDAKFRVSTSTPISASPPLPLFPSLQPTDLAYVIYTSGSTGNPKGVMIDHRGAVNTILDINRRFEVNAYDRVLAISALNFDLSVYDIFGTLAAGATIVMPSPEGDRDPAHWVQLLNTHGITLWNSVPALMQLFLTELASHPTHTNSLRLALLSGDWLPLSLPDQIRSQFTAAQVISLGGATEASIWSIFYPIDAIDPTWKSIPYGRPLTNQQWYVLNENLQPCPPWVPGQLYIGGTGLAKGYWQQAEKTAEAFIKAEGRRQKAEEESSQFDSIQNSKFKIRKPGVRSQESGVRSQESEGSREKGTGRREQERLELATNHQTPITNNEELIQNSKFKIQNSPTLYKTGDLGCYRPDGTIEFLGREDFQVKLNGYRVELGEIEAALVQHPMIREVVVAAVGETPQRQQLVAYVVPATGEAAGDGDDARVALNHPLAKLEFKQQRRGLRAFDASQESARLELQATQLGEAAAVGQAGGIALPLPATDPQPYRRRQSYRQFLDVPIALATFSQFLSGLKSIQLDASPLPKYRYGSAGSLYPVQTYLYVKSGRIEGIAGGFYYYHPAEHRLMPLGQLDPSDAGGLYGSNQAIAEQAAFALFLIGQMEAIAPIYPEDARDFCLLEAGYMSQLLMETAPDFELGLCPLGKLGFEPLRQALALDGSHQLLHGLAGGAIDPAWTQQLQLPEAARSGAVGGASITDALRQFLVQKLPPYMVPTAYQVLDALPLSANGKVDRKALPVPSSLLSREVPFVAPRTATEQAIATIWQAVLSLETVSIHANFFAAGGNSLSAMQALSQLRQAFPIELSIRQFFTAQTLVEQAAVVDSLLAEPTATPQVQADDAPIQRVTATDADSIQPIQRDSSPNLLSQVDDLSEQDVDSLLGQLLADDALGGEGQAELAAIAPPKEVAQEAPEQVTQGSTKGVSKSAEEEPS